MLPSKNQRLNDVDEVLAGALPPLHRKIRGHVVRDVIERLGLHAAEEAPGELVTRLPELTAAIRAEAASIDRESAELLEAHAAAPDAKAQRKVLVEYLTRTARSRRARREDVRALGRWMGVDALRERQERRRANLWIEEEIALRIVAGILGASDGAWLAARAPALAGTAAALLDVAATGARPQNRLAALEAVAVLARRAPGAVTSQADAAARLTAIVDEEGASPFLQAYALEALLRVDREGGLTLLRYRLRTPQRSRRDFLFRRQAVFAAAAVLPVAECLPIFAEVARTDPSEYVRMALAELAASHPEGVPLLRALAGLDGAHEASAKVRASTVLACARAAATGVPHAEACQDLLLDVLARDGEALVLRMGSELVAQLARTGRTPRSFLARAIDALGAIARRDAVSGPVREAAAAAEQAVSRCADPRRRAWTEHLARELLHIPVGGQRKLRVSPPPDGVPELPDDAAWLGAILADLSTDGDAVYAQRRGDFLTLWHGDQLRRRAWRIWHELFRPAPNKRQGFVHTTGRTMPGTLRAHPAHLDEITATTVPGERIHVASQGGWGRHLPTVDDLLDLPLHGDEPVQLFSSHGVTTVVPPPSFGERLKNRLRISRRYPELAALRLSSLAGTEPRERRRYVEQISRELGVQIHFRPYAAETRPPAPLAELFAQEPAAPLTAPPASYALHSVMTPFTAFVGVLVEEFLEARAYFLGMEGNGIAGLAIFTAAVFSYFLFDAYRKRQGIRAAREKVPLSIGGWGTRGKSGTERLKAALFTGLGFDVFAKTTGSEAMFVHSAPSGTPSEFFIFRPYDKATIWEQRDMLELGTRLRSEVFLWECMALQPAFVRLLQDDWMKDDYATLTNAYPDHEDIQGPAGIDVADAITEFIPENGVCITSEDHFLPLFRRKAEQKGATLHHSAWWEAELIPDELLDLFPYREHPRNMALVATLAEQLGVSRAQALALMAEHVQPEIGVLKVFPEAKVRGRVLTFINGHSANERTGFLNNWNRTGLGEVDCETQPERAVITVVNNRWDRVARSEVFARILVEDAAADRHVLIGTNLVGLQQYVRDALDRRLAQLDLVAPEDVRQGAEGRARASARLQRELARLKIPLPSTEAFLARAAVYAAGAGLELARTDALVAAVEQAFASPLIDTDVAGVRGDLEGPVGEALRAALISPSLPPEPARAELLAEATADEVVHHALYLLARMVVHARLQRALPRDGGGDVEEAIREFHRRFRRACRALFLEQLVPVPSAAATGDQVVDACARAVPPGVHVRVLGAQNIKGTGLDWVYRWIGLDKVQAALADLRDGAPDARRRAFEFLETFEDHGFLDTGLMRATLPLLAAASADPAEIARLQALAARADRLHEVKVAGLSGSGAVSRTTRLVGMVERWFDYLDSIRRRELSEQLLEDLVNGRVSHARAAVETRRLYERQKGGWLLAPLRDLFGRTQGASDAKVVLPPSIPVTGSLGNAAKGAKSGATPEQSDSQ